jgi:hypothetical protein
MPPGVRHLAAFKDNVVDRPLGQEMACGEASVASADDDGRYSLDGSTSQATSTVTSVGFVSASKTAERF